MLYHLKDTLSCSSMDMFFFFFFFFIIPVGIEGGSLKSAFFQNLQNRKVEFWLILR